MCCLVLENMQLDLTILDIVRVQKWAKWCIMAREAKLAKADLTSGINRTPTMSICSTRGVSVRRESPI
jgi:hypothetical protein